MIKHFLLSVVLVLSLFATPASAQTNGDNGDDSAETPQRSIDEVERELKRSVEERIITLERQVYDQNELNLRRIEYGEERVDSFERSLDRILLMFGLSLLLGFFLLGNVLSYKQRIALQRLSHATGDAENIMRDIKREITRPELEHLRISQVLRRLMRQLREKSDSSFTPEAITELRAAANDPYLPASLHFIARVLTAEQDGNWNVALQMLDQLREMDGKDPDVLLHLSHVHNNIAARTVDVRQKRSHQRWAYEFYAQFTALIKMDGIESAELPTLKNMKASGVADDSPLPAIAPAPAPTPIPPIATTAAADSKARAPEKKSGVLETKPAQPIPQPQYQPYPAGQIPRQESRTPQEAREAREARIAARKAQKKNTIPQSKPPIVAPAPAKASKPPPRPKPAAVKPPPLPPITPIPAVKPQTAAPAAAKVDTPPPAAATETKPAPTPAAATAETKPPPPATDTKPATPPPATPAAAETKPTPAAAPTPAPAAIPDPTKPQPAAAKLASKPEAKPAAASPTPLPDPTKPQPAAAKQEQSEPAKKPEPIIVETKPPATTKPAPIIVDSPKPPASTIPAPLPLPPKSAPSDAAKAAANGSGGNGATPPAAVELSKTGAPQQTASGETSLAASDFESSQDGKKRSFQDKLSSLRSMQKEKIVNASKNIVAAVGEMSSPMEGIRSLRNLVQAENEGELPFLPIPPISEVPESGEPKVINMWEETRKGDMQMAKAMTAKTLRERNRMIDQAMVFYAQAQMYKTDQVLYHNWGLALLAKALHVESKKRAPFFNAAIDKFLAGNVIAPHYFDFHLASLYAIIGDKDKCYHWLKESRESGKLDVETLQHAVDFDSVRREKWFDEFLTT